MGSLRALFTGLLVLIGSGVFLLPATAQTGEPSTPTWLGLSGSAGVRSEGYAASNIGRRQPSLSSEVFANVSVDILGAKTGVNLLYSTENNELRQSMNRLGFSTSWDWGKISAGTVSPSYSKYSLNGATLRGGSFQLSPGAWRFGVAGGRSQRAVEPSTEVGFRQPAYARWMYAARVGVGAKERSHLHLIGSYARDLQSSLDSVPDVRPKENVTVTPDVKVSLFDDHLTLETEVTLSAFTPDTRARRATTGVSALDVLPVRPRVGTHVDYAGRSRLQLRLDVFQLGARYERIQPGFRSLGLSRIRGDQEVMGLRPEVRLFDNAFTLGVTLRQMRNNLRNQRLTTRRRRQVGVNMSGRISRALSLNGSVMRMTSTTSAADAESALSSALKRTFTSHTFTLTPTLTLRSEATTHTISVTGNLQKLHTESGGGATRRTTRSNNLTTTLSYSTSFPSGFSFTLSGDLLRNDGVGSSSTSYGLNTSVSYAFLDRKLRTSLNAGWSSDRRSGNIPLQKSRQIRGTLDTSYRLPFGDRVHLSVSNLVNRSVEGSGRDYRETRVSLRYSHTF